MNAREKMGLHKDATVEEVKTWWQKIALVYHPDYGGNVNEFMEKQKLYKAAIKEALTPEKCSVCLDTKKIRKSRGFYTVFIVCPYCK